MGDALRPAPEWVDSENDHTFVVEGKESAMRLDRFLAERLREYGLSREKVKDLIRKGEVTVEGRPAGSPKQSLFSGSVVRVRVPARATSLTPEAGGLTVLYQDEELAVLDKPAGITVHPAPGLDTGTLAHRLVAHFPALAAQEGFRPGIVHRLDKDTSGLMLVALTEKCRLALADMFARHAVYKEYLALVRGVPKPCGVIDAPIGRHPTQKVKMAVIPQGKAAKSAWRTLYADPRGHFALVAVRIYSGRTHQVRVHMRHIGHPLWGDALYGGADEGSVPARASGAITRAVPFSGAGGSPSSLPASDVIRGDAPFLSSSETPGATAAVQAPIRQMLHAWRLAFIHPFPAVLAETEGFGANLRRKATPDGPALSFCCPPPADFSAAVRFLSRETFRVAITGSPGCGKSSLLDVWRRMGIPVFSADDEVRRLYEKGGNGQRLLRARFGTRFVPHPDAPVDKAVLGAAMRDEPGIRREVESLIHPLVRHAVQDFWQEQEAHGVPLAAAEIPLYLETDFAGSRASGGANQRPEGRQDLDGGNERPVGIKRFGGGDEQSAGLKAFRNGLRVASPQTAGQREAGDHAAPPRSIQPHAAHVLVGVHCPFALRQERLMGKRGWSKETIALMESWQWPEDKKMAACDLLVDNTGTEQELAERAKRAATALSALRQERELQRIVFIEKLWGDSDERGEEVDP